MSLISSSRCLPAALILLEVGDELLLAPRSGRLLLEHLAVADDGVERRAQLVAHVGQELGLVAARHLELAALLLELAEQPRVLDGQRGLGGEGLEQLDHLRRELARRLPVDDEPADQVILAQQRHRQHGPGPGPEEDVAQAALVGAFPPMSGTWTGSRVTAMRPGTPSPFRIGVAPRHLESPPRRGCRSRGSGTPRSPRRTRRSSPRRRRRAGWRGRRWSSSTVSRSSVELTAWPTSPSAVSSSTERVSSAVRACSSLSSRAFSMAMTAWSAKVFSSSIWLSVNARTSYR